MLSNGLLDFVCVPKDVLQDRDLISELSSWLYPYVDNDYADLLILTIYRIMGIEFIRTLKENPARLSSIVNYISNECVGIEVVYAVNMACSRDQKSTCME